MENTHEHYMQLCITLGEAALANGNPPVGAIVVHNDKVIGQGIESGKSTGDITNHAEILAVRAALAAGHGAQLGQATLYTTHEPCIMCSYLIRHHHIPLIVYGTEVPFIGGLTSQYKVLEAEDVPKWGKKPTVMGHVCYWQCLQLTEAYNNTNSK